MKQLLLVLGVVISISLSAQDFYFVQVTDTHLGYRNHDSITNVIIEKVNALPQKIVFVAITGDIFQNNMDNVKVVDSYLDVKSKFKPPVFEVPGNHDLLPKNYQALTEIYRSKIGPLNKVVNVQGVNLVMYYSIPMADTILPDFKESKQWITNVLDSLKNEQVLVFHHQPSVTDFYNNKNHNSWPVSTHEYWKRLVNKNNVDGIICGHFHRDEMHWLGNVPVYIASSIAGFWDRQASFRIYHYHQGKLSYQTVYIF